MVTWKQTDAYRSTGCYNHICTGFVSINEEFALGAAVANVSTMNGRQYDIPTSIWKVNIIRVLVYSIILTNILMIF